MSAGLEILSDTGSIQITQDYRNLLLRFSGYSSIGPGAEFHQRIRQCSQYALAAYQFLTYPGVCPHVGGYEGGMRGSSFMYHTPNPNQAFNYFIFDLVQPLYSNQGLEVYNEVGNLCFSSSDYPMKVIDYIDSTGEAPTSIAWREDPIYTNNTGKTIAFAPVQSNTYYDFDGSDEEEGLFFLQERGNQLWSSGAYYIWGGGAMGSSIRSNPATFRALILDVTNYPKNYSR